MRKLKGKQIVPLLIAFVVFATEKSTAQTKITLDQSIELALQNNRNIKIEKLRVAYAKAMIATSTADIPQTDLSLDYGQINSAYQDTKISISQRFGFPAVYRRQHARYTEEWKKSQLNVTLKEFELKKAVSLTYYNILYWQQKEKLLNEALYLYSSFLDKTILRKKAGESNALESATAANQKAAITIQLRQVADELKVFHLQFQWLLNTPEAYSPIQVEKAIFVQSSVVDHPLLKVLEQEKIIAAQATAVEKSRLLPQLLLGYNLNSFKGAGPDNRIYDASPRFHSVQLGLSIPVFSSGQRARIETTRLAETIASDELQNAQSALERRVQEFSQRYQTNLAIVNQYESEGLKNATIVFETAQKQFSNGAIDYLEFVTLINQAISLKSSYTDALWQLNENAIQLHYIMINQ